MTVVARTFRPALQPWPAARPLFMTAVPAGSPAPGEDAIETGLDLNRHLIRQPAATFFVRVSGDSMTGAGIFSGDLLVVDRSQSASDGSVVIAIVDGELTVKRLRRHPAGDPRGISLVSENPAYSPVQIGEGTDVDLWGVVTAVIHSFE